MSAIPTIEHEYRVAGGPWQTCTAAMDNGNGTTTINVGSASIPVGQLEVRSKQGLNRNTSAILSNAQAFTSAAPVPGTVTGLTAARSSSTSILISWSALADATSYIIEVSTDSNQWTVLTSSATGTSYTYTPGADVFRYIRMKGANASGASVSYSEVVSASTTDVPAPNASDTTAPSFSSGFPKNFPLANGVELQVSLNESGRVHFVVLGSTATAPSAAEVKAGTGAGGLAPVAKGTIQVPGSAKAYPYTIGSLGYSNTYDIYLVPEDVSGNLGSTPFKFENVTTRAALLLSDSFNTNKWEITDPVDATSIQPAVEYIRFSHDGDATGLDVNFAQTAQSFNSPALSVAARILASGSTATGQVYFALQSDNQNRALLVKNSTGEMGRLLVNIGGSNVYSFVTSTSLYGTWKIEYLYNAATPANSTIGFYKYINEAWALQGSHTGSIGSSVKGYLTGSGVAGSVRTTSFYEYRVAPFTYTTLRPDAA